MMSKHISGLLRELSSRNSNKPQSLTWAEEIQALVDIKDPVVKAADPVVKAAIDWRLKRPKIFDITILCLFVVVTLACIFVAIIVALKPLSAKALVVPTTLLAAMWRTLKNNVFNS